MHTKFAPPMHLPYTHKNSFWRNIILLFFMRFADTFCSLLSAFFEVRVLFFYVCAPLFPSHYHRCRFIPLMTLFFRFPPPFFRMNIVVVFPFPLPRVISCLAGVLRLLTCCFVSLCVVHFPSIDVDVFLCPPPCL